MAKYMTKTSFVPLRAHDEEHRELIQMGMWAGGAIIAIVAIVLYVLMHA